MANNKNTRTANSINNPFYRSPEEIRALADEQVELLMDFFSQLSIPTAYPEEVETDENTVELRKAIEKYIARTQDERRPYDPAEVKRVPWDIRERLQASA